MDKTSKEEIADILHKEFNVFSEKDFFNLEEEALSVLYENIKIVQEDSMLTDDEVDEMISAIFSRTQHKK